MMSKKKEIPPEVKPRDGLDNTGTQGYDSLTDDAYTGSSKKPDEHPGENESRTGSSGSDFHEEEDGKLVGSGE
jgi:hypothetical protein